MTCEKLTFRRSAIDTTVFLSGANPVKMLMKGVSLILKAAYEDISKADPTPRPARTSREAQEPRSTRRDARARRGERAARRRGPARDGPRAGREHRPALREAARDNGRTSWESLEAVDQTYADEAKEELPFEGTKKAGAKPGAAKPEESVAAAIKAKLRPVKDLLAKLDAIVEDGREAVGFCENIRGRLLVVADTLDNRLVQNQLMEPKLRAVPGTRKTTRPRNGLDETKDVIATLNRLIVDHKPMLSKSASKRGSGALAIGGGKASLSSASSYAKALFSTISLNVKIIKEAVKKASVGYEDEVVEMRAKARRKMEKMELEAQKEAEESAEASADDTLKADQKKLKEKVRGGKERLVTRSRTSSASSTSSQRRDGGDLERRYAIKDKAMDYTITIGSSPGATIR